MFSEAFLGNGATSVLGACAGGLDGMPLSDVIAAWRSVGDQVRGVLLYAATRVMLLTNVMLLYQLRHQAQRRRVAAYYLSYVTAVEGGVLPPSPIDYEEAHVCANNLCALPLVQLSAVIFLVMLL